MAASRLHRPHYLDKDLTFLYPQAGNRAMLFTPLTTLRRPFFQGAMMRQVYWWTESELPSLADARHLLDTDGVFFPDRVDLSRVRRWQEDYWLDVLADR